MTKEIVTSDEAGAVVERSLVVQNGNVLKLLDKAIEQLSSPNAPAAVEALTKLVDLYERLEMQRAKTGFADDMAKFQGNCPTIPKTSTANIVTKSGVKYSYKYAEIDQIANSIRPYLTEHGFSYTWDSKTDQSRIVCTCTLRHIEGHQESAVFEAPIDTQASMNETQKYAAALTYAKRQSLIQVLGLSTGEPDSDTNPMEPVSSDQAHTLEALITEIGANKVRFLSVYGVDSVDKLPSHLYDSAVKMLELKRRQGK